MSCIVLRYVHSILALLNNFSHEGILNFIKKNFFAHTEKMTLIFKKVQRILNWERIDASKSTTEKTKYPYPIQYKI